AERQRSGFRAPGRFADQCRIPTLVEVLDLHRKYAGLMHLDIKRPGLDRAIAELLTRMDLWDHVGYCNSETGGVILRDERYKPRRYKGNLYADRGEVFPESIAAVLKKPGDDVLCADPRGVAGALGGRLGKRSRDPAAPKLPAPGQGMKLPEEAELIARLRNAEDASGEQIRTRARAAERLLARKASSPEA